MGSKKFIMHMPEDARKVAEQRAAAMGISLAEAVREALRQMEPLPKLVHDFIRTLAVTYNLTAQQVVARAVIAYAARSNLEVELFGQELTGVDPFATPVGEGELLSNDYELYGHLYQRAKDEMLAIPELEARWDAHVMAEHDALKVRKAKLTTKK